MDAPYDVHNNLVRSSKIINQQVIRLQPEEAQARHNTQDEVQSEPGQVDISVLNEVLDGLLSIRVSVGRLTYSANHLPSDVCYGGKYINVEAARLNQ